MTKEEEKKKMEAMEGMVMGKRKMGKGRGG